MTNDEILAELPKLKELEEQYDTERELLKAQRKRVEKLTHKLNILKCVTEIDRGVALCVVTRNTTMRMRRANPTLGRLAVVTQLVTGKWIAELYKNLNELTDAQKKQAENRRELYHALWKITPGTRDKLLVVAREWVVKNANV